MYYIGPFAVATHVKNGLSTIKREPFAQAMVYVRTAAQHTFGQVIRIHFLELFLSAICLECGLFLFSIFFNLFCFETRLFLLFCFVSVFAFIFSCFEQILGTFDNSNDCFFSFFEITDIRNDSLDVCC